MVDCLVPRPHHGHPDRRAPRRHLQGIPRHRHALPARVHAENHRYPPGFEGCVQHAVQARLPPVRVVQLPKGQLHQHAVQLGQGLVDRPGLELPGVGGVVVLPLAAGQVHEGEDALGNHPLPLGARHQLHHRVGPGGGGVVLRGSDRPAPQGPHQNLSGCSDVLNWDLLHGVPLPLHCKCHFIMVPSDWGHQVRDPGVQNFEDYHLHVHRRPLPALGVRRREQGPQAQLHQPRGSPAVPHQRVGLPRRRLPVAQHRLIPALENVPDLLGQPALLVDLRGLRLRPENGPESPVLPAPVALLHQAAVGDLERRGARDRPEADAHVHLVPPRGVGFRRVPGARDGGAGGGAAGGLGVGAVSGEPGGAAGAGHSRVQHEPRYRPLRILASSHAGGPHGRRRPAQVPPRGVAPSFPTGFRAWGPVTAAVIPPRAAGGLVV
mmetsp:Transcript_68997/g.183853  ORF Transcript_68997/g.183853 Transcript_68997/m.183853 type:complete len:435 (-) Transcript_68997:180-1484(-)